MKQINKILKETINKTVKNILNESKMYIPNSIYIVFDGTSYYALYGCDVEEEIEDNDVEVVKGPFANWDEKVDELVEKLNDEAQGTQYYKSLYESRNISDRLTNKILAEVTNKLKRRKKINEAVDYDDYAAISEALGECGWSYTNAYDVRNNSTGQEGIRYIIEPYPNNTDGIKPLNVEQVKQKMIQLVGKDNVIFSEGQHRYAPEMKNISMIVIENY